jgi:hypothetical protein
MATLKRLASAGARSNIAAQFPDLYRAARAGDPGAVREIERILEAGTATPRNLGFEGSPSRELTPFGTRGPGLLAGNELIPAPTRAMTPQGDFPPPPKRGVLALEDARPNRAAVADDLFDDGPLPSRSRAGRKIAAAGAAGAGGAWVVNEMRPRDKADGQTTADLHAEQKPPPVVESPAKPNYREQAYAMMKDLNARRREAGGEVAGAAETQAEINRLLMLASDEDNAAINTNTVPAPTGTSDYRRMAQQKIAELNAWRRQNGREHPQVSSLMAEINRLTRMADDQANRRTTARR